MGALADQLIELGKVWGIVTGGVIGYVKTMQRHYLYLEKKLAERSVGETAVVRLTDEGQQVRKDLEKKAKELLNEVDQLRDEFEKRDDQRGDEIRKLAADIRDFTMSALQAWNSVLLQHKK